MAKAVQMFVGNNSYGDREHYAQREDGVWFTRSYGWNGYGMGYSRWSRVGEDLSPLVEGDVLDYGFKPLRRSDPKGLRLPNPS